MLKLTSLCPVSDRPHLNLTPRSALCLSHSLCHLPELWQALNLLLHLHSWQISPSTTERRLDSTSFSSSVSAQRLNGHPALSYQTIYMHSFRQKGNPSSRLLSVPWRSPPTTLPTATVNVPRQIVCKRNLCCQIHSLVTRLSLSKWGFHMLHFAMYQGIVSFLLNCDSPPKRTAVCICCIYCLFFFPSALVQCKGESGSFFLIC